MIYKRGVVVASLLIFYFFSSITGGDVVRAQVVPDDRLALERELSRLENQIDQYEETINSYQKKGKTLKGEIDNLNNQIAKTNLQIKAINIELTKLDVELAKNKQQIEVTEKNLEFNKRALTSALQNLYQTERANTVNLLVQNTSLSSFFANVQSLLEVQDSLRLVVERINRLRVELVDQKQDLALRKSDKEDLLTSRDLQRRSMESVKKEKSSILTKTKGEESKYQELLKTTKQTAGQIRSKIFAFLGGGEITFGKAYKLAKLVEQTVGVRPAFILAVLHVESGITRNVGRCKYQTAMNPLRDIPVFLKILSELRINPDTVVVSCANRDGAYGGAMGPAQFIPSTWILYKDRIAELTGHNPPSPWNNFDAFTATALFMKDKGAANLNSLSAAQRITKEREAAARYYAGSRWRRYLWTYGERVIVKARQFEEDIAELQKANGLSRN